MYCHEGHHGDTVDLNVDNLDVSIHVATLRDGGNIVIEESLSALSADGACFVLHGQSQEIVGVLNVSALYITLMSKNASASLFDTQHAFTPGLPAHCV